VLIFCLHYVLGRKHHIIIEDDARAIFGIEEFGFLENGKMDLKLQNFLISESKEEIKDVNMHIILKKYDNIATAEDEVQVRYKHSL